MSAEWTPSHSDTPFQRLGGAHVVLALVARFFGAMEEHEPALATQHPCDASGCVTAACRHRFALFLIGWLGGPPDYIAKFGQPRLLLRDESLRVRVVMKAAWLRSMKEALDCATIDPVVRRYLDERFAKDADVLRAIGSERRSLCPKVG